MIFESLEPRALGALQFVDAITGLQVDAPLQVEAPGVRWVRTLRGWYAVLRAPGADSLTGASLVAPGAAPIRLTVSDPAGKYLRRRYTMFFPRDPSATSANGLRRPAVVRMFRSPAARVEPGWAVIRGPVTGATAGSRLPGALVWVERSGTVLSRGLADERGEVLIGVPGIPVTTWGEQAGPVVTTQITVRLYVYWDPLGWRVPDPDDVEARRTSLRVRTRSNVPLSSGQRMVTTL